MVGGEVRDYTVGPPFCSPQQASRPNSKYCSNRCWSSLSSVLSSLGVCLLVLGYTLVGALTFMALEGRTNISPEPKINEHNHLRSRTVDKLWSITEDLNILYKDNWTRLAEQEVLKFQNILVRNYKMSGSAQKNYNWNFPSAFLYSLTLITTIGYGNVTPRTSWGRLITIAYALVGIPLMLVYLSTVGDTLAQYFRTIYGKLSQTKKKKQEKHKGVDHSFISAKATMHNHLPEKKYQEITCDIQERQRVPIVLTLFVVLAYIAGGACLFNRLENWSLIEGSYFCFTSLGTIGFGELIPGSKESGNEISVFISCAFILIGMAVIAMCFNLLQDETIVMVRKMNSWWNRPDKVEDEDLVSGLKSS